MTCVVGLTHKGSVYIGADSAGVQGWALTVRADEKVFSRGPFLMGFTTSFRMGQLLRYKLEVPEQVGTDVPGFMATVFIDAVRECLKAGGWATVKDGNESGGGFLVGYRGRLFTIGNDFQVGEAVDGYDSVGCGDELAKGVLFATKGKHPVKRVETALRAAEAHNAGVRAPFHVITLTVDIG